MSRRFSFKALKHWHSERKLNALCTKARVDRAEITYTLKGLLLAAENNNVPYKELGICGNISMWHGQRSIWLLCTLFKGWPAHSGDTAYPIKCTAIGEPKWFGERLELRKNLLRYTITKLENYENA